ncbi:PAS domain S-box protein [Allopusillimonas soli]|uniref:Sensory histidine kinase/phosphatase NtrB n=1 Tax=Allopusillimonas soli TaxID=659016 RepID=A0A853F862_9BURK|nr:nitrogen regulation protein NR(II) [Allopusillimonas soli]NYT36805.1 PAS domain-containing protein [Allopusillimonas soli]TEA75269.1 PAS domain S-box protein [Allopusillimonas soli]
MDVTSCDLLSTAVLFLDGQGAIEHANVAAEELFGQSRRQLRGQNVQQLLGADEALQARLPEALKGRFGTLRQDLVMAGTSGPHMISLAIVPLQGQPWAALLEARPMEHHLLLDRHRQLGEELAAQRESLRNLAHEIKNPLGGIRGAAQLLDSELYSDALREYTGVIMAEADRLASLVDRLISPQGDSLQKRKFNIHQACDRVHKLVSAEFPDIDVLRDYDASVPDLCGDFERLLQALLNMARNAAQALSESAPRDVAAMSAPPRIILRTRVGRQLLLGTHQARLGLIVSVVDNGPGVPPELRERIFHPLVTGRPHGTGLGLSLAQEFAQQHGGMIELVSHPDCTEFRMILPMEHPS